MEQSVGLEHVNCSEEGKTAVQAEPFSRVAVPLDMEAVATDPVEAGEGSVELFTEIFGVTGAVALDEAVLGTVPLSEDIDRIVELRRSDGRQEARLQEVVDQALAGGSHRRFLCRGDGARLHMSSWLMPLRHSSAWVFANSRAATRRCAGLRGQAAAPARRRARPADRRR